MGLKNRIAVYSSRHYDALRSVFSESLLHRFGIRRYWYDIDGWFAWRSAQEEALSAFPSGSRFVEVGTYLGRSLCSLGEVVERSGKKIDVIGIDTCRGSGPEGRYANDYHGDAVAAGGGTFTGALHKNVIDCGFGEKITLIISDSVSAARLFSDASLDELTSQEVPLRLPLLAVHIYTINSLQTADSNRVARDTPPSP